MKKSKMKALSGCDFVRNAKWDPQKRTEKGWALWAKREAARLSKRDRFGWNASLCHVERDGEKMLRISFGGQPE